MEKPLIISGARWISEEGEEKETFKVHFSKEEKKVFLFLFVGVQL